MTIPSTARKAGPLLGTGVQTAWPFAFKVFAASDIAVTIANTLGLETVLVLNTDYSVALNANQDTSPGGTITYPISGTALAVGSVLSIVGDLDYDQPLDLPSGGNFSPLALENELDRLTMQIQQLKETLGRALLAPVTSAAVTTLPSPEANQLIGWDATGENLQNVPLSDLATAVGYGTFRYDTFVGDGSTTTFALSANPAAIANLDVAVDGLTFVPSTNYSLVSSTLVFSVAPVLGAEILARYGQALPIASAADASAVAYQPAGTLVATNVEDAINEIVADLAASSGSSLVGFKRTDLANSVASTLSLWHAAQFTNLLGDYLNGAIGTAAVNTSALNNAIADLPSGGTIYIGSVAGTIPLNAITVGSPNIKIVMDAGTTLQWATLGANTRGFTVNADNFTISGGKLLGPGAAADVSDEAAIWMAGTSTSVRKTGLTVDNVEITGFGLYGIYGQFVNNIKITNSNVHGTRMHGICFLSCNDITETGNWVHDIVLGSNGNAYGFIHSHNATNYHLDGSAATNGRLAANPFCIGVYCVGNTVENIGWEGIDCHGAYDTTISANRVYNTKLGISAPSSSNDGAAYAGEQNFVTNNLVTAFKRDGTVGSYHNLGYGINLNGGATVNNRRVVCTGNALIGKGEISVNGGGVIRAIYCMHVNISNNEVHDWGGQCIYVLDTIGVINANVFGGMTSSGDTAGQCIRVDGTGDRLTISNNKHWYANKSRAVEGLRLLAINANRQILTGNDFSEATTPYIVNPTQVLGTDITPVLDLSGGGVNLDIAPLAGWNGIVELSGATSHNVSDILNIKAGQEIAVVKTGAGTVTFIRTGSPGIYLDGGTNKTITLRNNITLRNLTGRVVQTGYSTSS